MPMCRAEVTQPFECRRDDSTNRPAPRVDVLNRRVPGVPDVSWPKRREIGPTLGIKERLKTHAKSTDAEPPRVRAVISR